MGLSALGALDLRAETSLFGAVSTGTAIYTADQSDAAFLKQGVLANALASIPDLDVFDTDLYDIIGTLNAVKLGIATEKPYYGNPQIFFFKQENEDVPNRFHVSSNDVITVYGRGFTRPNIISGKIGKLEVGGNSFAYSFQVSDLNIISNFKATFKIQASEDPDQTVETLESDSITGKMVLRLFTQMTKSNDLVSQWHDPEDDQLFNYSGNPVIYGFTQENAANAGEFHVSANDLVTIRGKGFTKPNIISGKFGKLEAGGNSFAYAFNPTAITVIDANTVTCKVSAAEDPDQTDETLAANSTANLIVLRVFTQMTKSNDFTAKYVPLEN